MLNLSSDLPFALLHNFLVSLIKKHLLSPFFLKWAKTRNVEGQGGFGNDQEKTPVHFSGLALLSISCGSETWYYLHCSSNIKIELNSLRFLLCLNTGTCPSTWLLISCLHQYWALDIQFMINWDGQDIKCILALQQLNSQRLPVWFCMLWKTTMLLLELWCVNAC